MSTIDLAVIAERTVEEMEARAHRLLAEAARLRARYLRPTRPLTVEEFDALCQAFAGRQGAYRRRPRPRKEANRA